jgi:hypothetical protein
MNSDNGSYFLLFFDFFCSNVGRGLRGKREQEDQLTNMPREDFPRPIWQQVACEESCWSPIKRYRGCRQARNMLTAIGSCYQWKLWFKYRKFINTMENIEKGIEDFDCNPEGIEILFKKKKPLRSVTAAGRGAA